MLLKRHPAESNKLKAMRWPGQKRIWKGAPPAAIAEHITIDAVIEPIQRWHTSNDVETTQA